MKFLALVPVLIICLFAVSCRDRRPVAPKASAPAPVCEKRTPATCLSLARELEEQGNSRYLEAFEAACAMKNAAACERVLDEVDLTVMPAPTPAHLETWKHRLAQLCSSGQARACVFRDLLTFSENPMDASAMKKAYFRLQETCRVNAGRVNAGRVNSGRADADPKDTSVCVSLVQALNLVARKNSAFFKANALTGFQTACLGGVGEACMHDALLQREKRDLEWTLSYLLKACELGETAGCDQLVNEARKAVIDGVPRWNRSANQLKPACFGAESRAACQLWAEGHVRGWWEGADPVAGHAENLRQCGLGYEVGCIEHARRVLDTAPDKRAWALQILRQTCSEGHKEACVLFAQATRKAGVADPEADREAADILRAGCFGPGGSQPGYHSEYDYDRSSYANTYNNPACAVLGRYLIEGIGLEASEPVGFRLLGSGCSSLVSGDCVYLGQVLRKKDQTNAAGITPVYERICLAGYEEGCFALAEMHKTGYKELKPSDAQVKKYRAIGCRLAPANPACKNGQ